MKNDEGVVEFKNVVVMQLRFKLDEYDRFKKLVKKMRQIWRVNLKDLDLNSVSEAKIAKAILMFQVDSIEPKTKEVIKDEKEG